jgi:hypothetical protein
VTLAERGPEPSALGGLTMGAYNRLRVGAIVCPRCGITVREAVVDCHFGDTSQMVDLTVGDQYPWLAGKAVQNGGRPEHGDIDGEGYAECPRCAKDFFLKIIVRDDRIVGAAVDSSRPGYVVD